ncbi:MAG: OmpA family protein [Bacteroidales bacterium]|nr:OmpA family protein [Bacteroidales bacterium]
MKRIISTYLFIISTIFLTAQNYSVKDKSAINLFEKALAYYNIGQLEQAKSTAKKAIERNNKFIEAYLLIADIFNEQNKAENEIFYLQKVIEINPDFDEKIYFALSKAMFKLGKYKDALQNAEIYMNKISDEKKISEAHNWLKRIEFIIKAYENPVPFNPVRLSDKVNTPYKDYWPSLTINEQELYFTVALPTEKRAPNGSVIYQEDLFFTKKSENGEWQLAKKLDNDINSNDNEGAQSISANGQFLFYVACNRKNDYGSCDIYYSERTPQGWTKPKNLGPPVCTRYWESTPAASADGRMLFFSSGGRPDSKGGKDLYVSFKKTDGTWTEPRNLGDSINTSGNEYAPFLHPDGKTLYFSSDGWMGMGGQDIFMSQMKPDSTWTTPKNLGYPINTSSDDFGLIVNANGKYAFFASNREGSLDWDLYTFELYDEVRPDPVIYLTGKIFDAKTKQTLRANIEIYDLENKSLIYNATSNELNGQYIACIPKRTQYAMNVSAQGYLFYSEYFSLESLRKIETSFQLDVPLIPIEVGQTIILKNIFYETDKYNLKPESEVELNKLVQFLRQNSTIGIEISGHTDNVGTAEYNKTLSTNRAKLVYEYLISKGISSNRLTYTGYGYSKPIANNDTPEGRALNRRTELKITKIK